jgi:hypothetical protein
MYQFSSLLSSVTRLYIGSDRSSSDLGDSELEDLMDNTEWLVLFRPCTAVRTLHLYGKIQPFVLSALRGCTGESVAEMLPELRNLHAPKYYYLRRVPEEQTIKQFITAHQHSGHPVIIHRPVYYDGD